MPLNSLKKTIFYWQMKESGKKWKMRTMNAF